jgi:hypothetical protein
MTTTPCVTRAWLVLGALTMQLEDEAGGWFMTELDLGYPEVREVVNNRPDANGIYDRTQFFGSRPVSASVTAVKWVGAVIDDVAARFAPFMVPAARPVLHYVLDRPGLPERVLTLRAANYGFVIDNPDSREIHLQWVAADPVVRDPAGHTATAFAGSSAGSGRRYNLAFNRVYPSGGGGPSTATLYSPGDITVSPLLRIFGPVTAPVVSFSGGNGAFAMLPTLTVSGGHFVEVDTATKTAWLDGDRAQNLLSYVDWATIYAQGGWPRIPPKTNVTMTMTGQSTSGSTQAQALWNDGYLS